MVFCLFGIHIPSLIYLFQSFFRFQPESCLQRGSVAHQSNIVCALARNVCLLDNFYRHGFKFSNSSLHQNLTSVWSFDCCISPALPCVVPTVKDPLPPVTYAGSKQTIHFLRPFDPTLPCKPWASQPFRHQRSCVWHSRALQKPCPSTLAGACVLMYLPYSELFLIITWKNLYWMK